MLGIYELKFKDGSCYIGLSRSLGSRFAQHLRELEKNTHGNKNLQQAFNLQGPPIFTILQQCSTVDELDAEETRYISKYLIKGIQLLNIAKMPRIPPIVLPRPDVSFNSKVKTLVILRNVQKIQEDILRKEIELEQLRVKEYECTKVLEAFGTHLSDEELAAMDALDLCTYTV